MQSPVGLYANNMRSSLAYATINLHMHNSICMLNVYLKVIWFNLLLEI